MLREINPLTFSEMTPQSEGKKAEKKTGQKRRSKSYYSNRQKKRLLEKSRLKTGFGVKSVQVDLGWKHQFEMDCSKDLLIQKGMKISRTSSKQIGVQTEISFGEPKEISCIDELELDMIVEDHGEVKPRLENGVLAIDPRMKTQPSEEVKSPLEDKNQETATIGVADSPDDLDRELERLVSEK